MGRDSVEHRLAKLRQTDGRTDGRTDHDDNVNRANTTTCRKKTLPSADLSGNSYEIIVKYLDTMLNVTPRDGLVRTLFTEGL